MQPPWMALVGHLRGLLYGDSMRAMEHLRRVVERVMAEYPLASFEMEALLSEYSTMTARAYKDIKPLVENRIADVFVQQLLEQFPLEDAEVAP